MEGANENLLNGGASSSAQKTDDEKSMAIVNLQAMLNTDDIEKVIELLEQNGYDESLAASAFFAQQMAGGGQGAAGPG